MKYFDGTDVVLGDLVSVPVPLGTAKARVVMLGQNYSYVDDIDPKFLSWVKRNKVLEAEKIVIEWMEENPFAHNNPKYAPVGKYMFSPVDEFVQPIRSSGLDKPENLK